MRNLHTKSRTKKAKISIITFSLILVVSMFLAGCIGQEEPPTDVKTYVFGFNSDPCTLDPAIVFDDSSIQMGRVYETLVRVAPDMTVEPALATSWGVSEDGLTWTFNLRQGVKFHDGSDFDAEAVKFSFERNLEIDKGPSYILYVIDTMEIVDTYTIKFTLSYPVPFDYIMGSQYGAYIVSPTYVKEHEVDGDLGQAWLAEHTSGTGPYMLTEWIPGQQVILKKFDDYWGGWDGKHVDTVIIKVIRETATAEIEIKEGKIDSTWILTYEAVDALREDPDFVILETPTLHTLYWRINTQKPPTDDVLVRQALSYAFPYDDVIESVYLGRHGERLYGPLPKGIWGYDDDPPLKYELNLDKAAQLLEDAGYPNGENLPPIDLYYYSPSESQRKMAELFKSNLAEIGVTLNTRGFPFNELMALACCDPEGGPHLSAHDWWPTYTDPYDFLYGCWATDQYFNWAFWSNAEFDALLEEANSLSVVDKPKSIELYKQAQRMIVEEATTIFLVQLVEFSAHRAWVHGYSPNPNYPYVPDYYSVYKEV